MASSLPCVVGLGKNCGFGWKKKKSLQCTKLVLTISAFNPDHYNILAKFQFFTKMHFLCAWFNTSFKGAVQNILGTTKVPFLHGGQSSSVYCI